MFFQINVTPKANKNVEAVKKENKNENLYYSLVLAPFQPQTKIELVAAVNTTIECYVDIKNISDKPINVNVTKQPVDEHRIVLSALGAKINAHGCTRISIKWNPIEPGSWRDVIQLTDNRRIKYEIPMVALAKGLSNGAKKKSKQHKSFFTDNSQNFCMNPKKVPEKCYGLKPNESINKACSSKSIQNKENIYEYNFQKPRLTLQHISTPVKKIDSKDFSKLMDNDFSLTPLKTSPSAKNNFLIKSDFSPQELKSLNVESSSEVLRRETYIIPTTTNNEPLSDYQPGENNFEDSLSPLEKKVKCEFSTIVDNIGLSVTNTIITPQYQQTLNCIKVEKVTSDETFEIISQNISTDLKPDRTFEVPITSPTASKTFAIPRQLSTNFGSLSPVTPIVNDTKLHTGNLPSSSPIYFNNDYKLQNCSIKLSFVDPNVTAKEVLEADLWVDPFNKKQRATIMEDLSSNTTATIKNKDSMPRKKWEKNTLSLQISPPCKMPAKLPAIRRASPNRVAKLRKEKIMLEGSFKKKLSTSLKKSELIADVRMSRLSLANLKSKKYQPMTSEVSVKLHDPNNLTSQFCNPDPFAVTTIEDPFLASTLYFDDKWVYQQEIKFKKWLNTLLSPPEHLTADVENTCIDIGQVWQSSRLKDNSVLAETKEVVSARYHTNIRLNTLRKAACAMFRRNEVVQVLSKTTVCVEKGILNIRLDRDLHRDIGLQKTILELFLSYNPLWLRIGLETIYGETIPLQSNDDLVGLTRFLLLRFFSDPFLSKNYVHPYLKTQPAFITQMNKFMLKKFLLLVYFLDYAKMNKLIGHDPCLFHKKAIYKDSRSILLTFSREVLSGIGDITKVLRAYNYIVHHKQTYLEEYDYAVTELSTDLRDGVRLCRVMELISGRRDITKNCRVPAISRLQKVHNVDMALKTLFQCGYTLTGGIDAKSIADGHREKTLSLLWQIIYKYQEPRFQKAAAVIQKWWRALLYYIRVKSFLRNRKHNATCIIQRAWRCYLAKKRLNYLREEYNRDLAIKKEAASIIQLYWRKNSIARKERENFLKISKATKIIKNWWMILRATRPFVRSLQRKRYAIILIQRKFRATLSMRNQRELYLQLREAAIVFQLYWRARVYGKSIRMKYLRLKHAAIIVQSRYKANKLMKFERENYFKKLQAAKNIQIWWKGMSRTKRERSDFLLKKCAVLTIEKWWLIISDLNEQRILQQKASIKIQSWWRLIMAQNKYRRMKLSCKKIQTWWRNLLIVRSTRKEYIAKREATIKIQRLWKSKEMRRSFLRKKKAAQILQERYRNKRAAKIQREHYLLKKSASVVIQRRWKSKKARDEVRYNYLKYREAVISIQRRRRALKLGRSSRQVYLNMKIACIKIQSWYRMIKVRKVYKQTLKTIQEAAIVLQRRWRAKKLTEIARQSYLRLKTSTIKIQIRWRAEILSKKVRNNYLLIRSSIIAIQRTWRALIAGRIQRNEFLLYKKYTICIQRRFRALRIAQETRKWYLNYREHVLVIQRRWRGKLVSRRTRNYIKHLNKSATTIQAFWRMKIQRDDYLRIKYAATIIQYYWRSILAKRKVRQDYLLKRRTAIVLQRNYRSRSESNKIRRIENKAATIIQSAWKGYWTRKDQCKKIRDLRQRCEKANNDASPTSTLAHRFEENLFLLQNCRCIGELSICLMSLDTITKLSPNGCINLCKSNIVENLYNVLKDFNRSLPWVNVCLRGTSILITLAKFCATKQYVILKEHALTLALLINNSTQFNDLSLHLVTLFWLLCRDSEYSNGVVNSPKIVWLLSSAYTRVQKKKNERITTPQSAKMEFALPSLEPNWGGLKQSSPRLFENIHFAMTTLMKQLKITPVF
ncbi:protein abnormal spindle [Prorops nasuta]|uniref:protein abnormal spindle n=1 Tax=Prorops nasuta TaxID=863751 RepID=UPI0034CFA3E8